MKNYKFVIVNDMDRPDKYHVAQIVGKDKAAYLHTDLRNHEKMTLNTQTTNIEKFGFYVKVINDVAWFVKTENSKATYKDGRTREWQGCDSDFKLVVKLLIKNI